MTAYKESFQGFQLTGSATVLGTDFLGYRHPDGTRLVVPEVMAASLPQKPEVLHLIGRIAAHIGKHDNFYDGPALQQSFDLRALRTPVPAGEWSGRGSTASLYHHLGSRCVIKTFDVPAPHEGITQFAVMASLADQLTAGRLKVPAQYSLVQSAHSLHQTVVMEAIGGDVLSQTVYRQYSDVTLHAQQLQLLMSSEIPKQLRPYVNDATDHQSNFIHSADGSYTLLDQPVMSFPILARRSLQMRALDRLLY